MLELGLADGRRLQLGLPGTNQLWKTIELDLRRLTQPLVSLTLIDAGDDWGEWSAVALPLAEGE
jgi:hypothetical protein